MARTITCDVQGCAKKATPVSLVFKGNLELDICDDHRRALAEAGDLKKPTAVTAPAPKAGRAKAPRKPKKKAGPGAGQSAADGRGRKPQTPEVRALYARAKAWHVAQGTVPATHRGQVSAAQVEAYTTATDDSA